jgi:hypothetical protein
MTALLQQPQLQADRVLTRTKSRLMLALVSQLLPLIAQIVTYDKEIRTLSLTLRTPPFLRVCRVRVNTWLPGSWLRLGMIEGATRMQVVCKHWQEPRQSSIRVVCIPKLIGDWGASNHCAMSCINLRGRVPKVKHGPKTTISANERKAKATPLLSGPFRMFGSESSLQCGLVESVIRQRRLSWLSSSTPAELPNAASIAM